MDIRYENAGWYDPVKEPPRNYASANARRKVEIILETGFYPLAPRTFDFTSCVNHIFDLTDEIVAWRNVQNLPEEEIAKSCFPTWHISKEKLPATGKDCVAKVALEGGGYLMRLSKYYHCNKAWKVRDDYSDGIPAADDCVYAWRYADEAY